MEENESQNMDWTQTVPRSWRVTVMHLAAQHEVYPWNTHFESEKVHLCTSIVERHVKHGFSGLHINVE